MLAVVSSGASGPASHCSLPGSRPRIIEGATVGNRAQHNLSLNMA